MGARSLALAALALVACERTSAKYCELHGLADPTNCGFMDAPIDTPMACTVDTMCTPGRCNTLTMQCVQCLTGSDCTPASPFCDPQTYTCGACRTNADCAESGACLPNGQCAASTDVIYANGTSGDDTNPCTLQAPCKTIKHALTMLNTTHTTIKLAGAFDEAVVFTKQTATVLADPGTTLTASGGGGNAITFAMTGSNVQIYDLEIAHTMKSAAVVAAGNTLGLTRVSIHDCGAVAVTNAGSLTLSRSRIYSNTLGGLSLASSFEVTNNFIDHNGNDGTAFGGVSIGMAGQSTFEFNTVVDNDAKGGGANVGGVACTVAGFHAPNNIIAHNTLAADPAAANANVAANSPCIFDDSAIQADVTSFAFKDPDTAFDYHLGSASSALDKATVPSLITEDIDSEARPYGPAKDLGADEYHP
jgi:hypothetical protein